MDRDGLQHKGGLGQLDIFLGQLLVQRDVFWSGLYLYVRHVPNVSLMLVG